MNTTVTKTPIVTHCRNCRFWEQYQHTATMGMCHARPPLASSAIVSEQPTTSEDGWCGLGEALTPDRPNKAAPVLA